MKYERWTPELRSWLESSARTAGFDASGVAGVGDPESPDAAQEATRFATWVEVGRAGEMEYLKRRDEGGTLVRSGLHVAIPWALSVVVCALNYNAGAPFSIDAAPPGTGWIARYAWSGRTSEDGAQVPTDYHDELLGRLRRIETELLAQTACTTRCYVDTGPLVERSFAVRAGIGWIGKNTCVLNQQMGSWLLLGVIVTSLPLEEGGTATVIAQDRCGTCTRCIDACPTGAFIAPYQLDSNKCIAYLTIEKRGDIPVEFRAGMGHQVFGCDICQDVCPWNRKAPATTATEFQPRPELVNPALDWLAEMSVEEFRSVFRGSPIKRAKREGLRRNAAIAMGNSGEKKFLPLLDRIIDDEDEAGSVASSARWAKSKLEKLESLPEE